MMEELYTEMKYRNKKTSFRQALTLLEMVVAMTIMAIVFAVLVPQLRAIHYSWDAKASDTEILQNGRILIDHIQRNLASVTQITSVSSPAETNGYIEFHDSDANSIDSFRYDINSETGYVEFGPAGNLVDLAGPVSQFLITCYDANDMDAPLDPVTDPDEVRMIKVQAVLPNQSAMGQDLTVTTSAFLWADHDETIGDEGILLFVTGGQLIMDPFGGVICVPTAQERNRIILIESWGYTVNLIHENLPQAEFDAAVADANVAYVPATISDTALNTKLKSTPIGIVIEKMMSQLGISNGWLPRTRQEIDIIDNSHYITSPFGIGLLKYLTAVQPVTEMSWGLAPGLTTLADVFDVGSQWEPALGVIDIGGELVGGEMAAGRRVQLPWGETVFAFTTLNSNGKIIMKRSIEWAAAVKGCCVEPGPGEGTYRDEFNESSYSGNDGTLTWIGDWQEINESDGCVRGDEIVMADPLASPRPPSNQLRVRDNDGGGEGVMRQANLDGAVTAMLSLLSRRAGLDDASDYVAVEVSTSGITGPWIEIVRFEGPADESGYQFFSQDISAYISANFVIRFISSPTLDGREDVWFDEVEIQISQ